MKKAAIFRSVSSARQATEEKASLEMQDRRCRDAAKKLGCVVALDLLVPGQSRNIHSLEMAVREIDAYAQLVSACENGDIDVLIGDRSDRFGRHRLLSMAVYDLCDRSGISVYDVEAKELTQPGDDPLPVIIRSYMSDRAVRQTAKNSLSGRVGQAENGVFVSKLPFGYKWVYAADGTRFVEIDEEQATVVRRIVNLYLSGRGGRSIMAELNADGLRRPNGLPWDMGHIYKITQIVRTYGGEICFMGKHYPGQHEPIIDAQTVTAVERERKARAVNKNYGRPSHLFSRMLECADCKYNMVVKTYKRKDGTKGTNYRCRFCHRVISENIVKNAFANWLEKIMLGNEEIEYTSEEKSTAELRQEIEAQIAVVDDSLKILDARYISGKLPEKRYDAQLEPLESKREALQTRLTEIDVQFPHYEEIDENTASLVLVAINRDSPSEVNAIIRQFITMAFDPSDRTIKFVRKV